MFFSSLWVKGVQPPSLSINKAQMRHRLVGGREQRGTATSGAAWLRFPRFSVAKAALRPLIADTLHSHEQLYALLSSQPVWKGGKKQNKQNPKKAQPYPVILSHSCSRGMGACEACCPAAVCQCLCAFHQVSSLNANHPTAQPYRPFWDHTAALESQEFIQETHILTFFNVFRSSMQ